MLLFSWAPVVAACKPQTPVTQAAAPSKPPICPALCNCGYPLMNLVQISVNSSRHYISVIKTEE